ncbi:hypothetical protein RvY_13739-4 [Ramazzottius varieornatus]|uniref:Uncharacterized protein n=1 Tax=Ramazzottius varieornatus TaxID=947166 RepID=A0A1D1VNY9_RAMVA|nr:hypothetical protein RvY_13739-4 [Ramazzottius varieornatus]
MGRSRSRSPPAAAKKTSARDEEVKKITRDGEDKKMKDKSKIPRKREREQVTDDAEDERKKSALARFKRGRRRSSSISSSDSSPDRRETRRFNSNRNDARRDTRPPRDTDLRNEAKDFQRLMDLEKQRWLRQKELETKILEEHALKRTEAKIADRISEALITERVKFQQELKEKLDACKRDMKDQLREEVRQEFRWEMEQLQLREV